MRENEMTLSPSPCGGEQRAASASEARYTGLSTSPTGGRFGLYADSTFKSVVARVAREIEHHVTGS